VKLTGTYPEKVGPRRMRTECARQALCMTLGAERLVWRGTLATYDLESDAKGRCRPFRPGCTKGADEAVETGILVDKPGHVYGFVIGQRRALWYRRLRTSSARTTDSGRISMSRLGRRAVAQVSSYELLSIGGPWESVGVGRRPVAQSRSSLNSRPDISSKASKARFVRRRAPDRTPSSSRAMRCEGID
jgi:hypothetical protein